MAKLYTLDGKLLTGCPVVQIGDKSYTVDNRKSTVEKIMEASKNNSDIETIDKTLKIVLGAQYKKDEFDNLPFPAYTKAFELIIAAATGEDEEDVEARFQRKGDTESK